MEGKARSIEIDKTAVTFELKSDDQRMSFRFPARQARRPRAPHSPPQFPPKGRSPAGHRLRLPRSPRGPAAGNHHARPRLLAGQECGKVVSA